MATITTGRQTIYSDPHVSVFWSWPSIGAYQHIQVNSAAWHWTASRYAVPYYDRSHGSMIPTNGGNGHNKEGVTTANLGITASTTSADAYFDMYQSDPGSADVWFVIDYDIINDVPPSTLAGSNAVSGQVNTITMGNSAGLSQVWHRTVWFIGDFSQSVDTGTGVSSASLQIPTNWQTAFSGSSATMGITLHTYLASDNSYVGSNTIYVTLTRDVNYDVPASSVSVTSVTGGEASVVSFSNSYLANAKHQVTWSIGNNSHTETTALGDSSVSYLIPTSWCENFPNATSGTLTVTIQTLNAYNQACGAAIVRTVSLFVPNYTPTVSAAAAGINMSWHLYL